MYFFFPIYFVQLKSYTDSVNQSTERNESTGAIQQRDSRHRGGCRSVQYINFSVVNHEVAVDRKS